VGSLIHCLLLWIGSEPAQCYEHWAGSLTLSYLSRLSKWFRNSFVASLRSIKDRPSQMLLLGRATTPYPGAKTWPSTWPQGSAQILYEILTYGRLGHQPWSFGAVTSRPSFDISLRAISRSRPRARKMRRRLTALAGATDNRISGSTQIIATAASPAST
jgi:hypothetical protein